MASQFGLISAREGISRRYLNEEFRRSFFSLLGSSMFRGEVLSFLISARQAHYLDIREAGLSIKLGEVDLPYVLQVDPCTTPVALL